MGMDHDLIIFSHFHGLLFSVSVDVYILTTVIYYPVFNFHYALLSHSAYQKYVKESKYSHQSQDIEKIGPIKPPTA